MKKIFSILSIATLFTATVVSCTKTETAPEYLSTDKNSLSLEFENRIADQKIVLGTTKGTNAAGEDFTVTTLNYFISNVSLKNDKGEVIKFPDNYFLVRQADANSMSPTLSNVPAGNYTELTYTIGVDSVKSISDVSQRTGVLDPASYGTDNMYWSWNAGYIFFKMEGISSFAAKNAAGEQKYQLHIGGFGGKTTVTPNNLKTVTIALSTPATVRKNIAPAIHLITDVSKVFGATNVISLAKSSVIMAPAAGLVVSQNYAKAYALDHVHNDMK